MVFSSPVISVVRATEIDETSDSDFRPDLVTGSQYGSAGTHLESDAIEGVVAENRSKRPRYPLVFDEAAAPATRIDQTTGIEGISGLAIVGQRVLQQQRVLVPDVMIQSPRDLCLCARRLEILLD